MYKKMFINFVMVMLIPLVFFGCMPTKQMETESGKQLPESFVKLYQYIGLADSFYWSAKESLLSANEKGLVDEQYKDEIVESLKTFNQVKSSTHSALQEWYNAVEQGKSVDSQKVRAIIEGMSTLAKESDRLRESIMKATDGKVNLQSQLGKQLNNALSQILKSKIGGE